jgi:hypothetical protein
MPFVLGSRRCPAFGSFKASNPPSTDNLVNFRITISVNLNECEMQEGEQDEDSEQDEVRLCVFFLHELLCVAPLLGHHHSVYHLFIAARLTLACNRLAPRRPPTSPSRWPRAR